MAPQHAHIGIVALLVIRIGMAAACAPSVRISEETHFSVASVLGVDP